jgi:restriction system protein
MAIPDYQSTMLPLLKYTADGKDHPIREVIETLADQFNLTEQERRELLPSGQQAIFDNRVAWARTYMKKAGLPEAPRRGHIRITKRGMDVIALNPPRMDVDFLEQFPEFIEFRTLRHPKGEPGGQPTDLNKTPEESLETAYQNLRESVANDLLQQVKTSRPALFERIVVELLVSMGYGGSLKDAGRAIGKSGDEGIDGIIKEDRLGLDIIYVQAKRWEGTVGRPEIQKFAGALQGQRTRKGIFITTSDFTRDAYEYASRIETKIVLIDG